MRRDYYSSSVIRDRKDGANNLVTEQDYSHQQASVHADIYKLMENYKIRVLWQKMRGVIEEEEKRKKEKEEMEMEMKAFSEPERGEGGWVGSKDWVATWIPASRY